MTDRLKLNEAEVAELGAFDPGDAYNAMAESFRREVAGMAAAAMSLTIFRDLTPEERITCFMAGAITGLIGSLFASISEDSRPGLMQMIADYLPHARANAEAMLADPDGDFGWER